MSRPAQGSSGHEVTGMLLAAVVAASFAANTAFARLAYEAGSNALTMLTLRTAAALIALIVLLLIKRVPIALPGAQGIKALGLGVLMATYSYGLLGSIQYVPLAVGVVTFYTYPVLTAMVSAATGRDQLNMKLLLALAVAFAGVVLVADLRGASFHPLGIGHALAAAVAFTMLLLFSDRVRGDGDSRPITAHMLAMTLACYGTACVVTGLFSLPDTTRGWIGFIGNPVFYSFSIICLFVAMRRIGPVRTALIMNVEPVGSALLGYLLLDQTLSAWQVLGVAMVIGAVVSLRLPAAGSADDARSAPWPMFWMVCGASLLATAALLFPR